MEIKVKIIQVREGYATIQCDNPADGLKRADELYNRQGHELPDMEDVSDLRFSLAGVIHQTREEVMKAGPLTAQEVELYLMSQGYPHPGAAEMGWLLHAGERQVQATEAVRNHYDLPDVDRWFHLMDVVSNELSFRGAMLISDVLYEKDSDAMEVSSVQQISYLTEGEIFDRVDHLSSCFHTGELADNPWNVTEQDVSFLLKEFGPGNILPEAVVFYTAGSVKYPLFDCSYADGIKYCEEHNWVLKDDNDFVWDLELEDQRELDKQEPVFTSKEDLFKALETASVIEYKGIRFDDWCVDLEQGGVWAEICQDHADEFKDLISGELSDDDAIGTCSVEGCDVIGMESGKGHYYIDFQPELIHIVEARSQIRDNEPQKAPVAREKISLSAQIHSAQSRASAPSKVSEGREQEPSL